MPKVSVVMPVLDPGPFFERALGSTLAQSFGDLELIAVDSGSTDGTRERLAAETDPRLHVIDLPGRCGPATPANLAIALARGEYIAFMDADDEMHPERLARQVAFLDATPEVDCLGSTFTLVREGRRSPRTQPAGDARIKAMLLNCNGNAIHNPTVMLRAAFLQDRGLGYPTILTDHDHALWVAMAKAGATFANLEDDLLTYNRHATNYTARHAEMYRWGKAPIRAELLLALYPDLTALEAGAIAGLMTERASHGLAEACAGMRAVERVTRMAGCALGADHAVAVQILRYHHGRAAGALKRFGASAG